MSDSLLFRSILQAFETNKWTYHRVEGMEVAEAGFEMHHGRAHVHAQAYPDHHIVQIVATASLKVSRPRFNKASELLMTVNKSLNLGNFEMDWGNGSVMFRCNNIFSPSHIDVGIIASLLHNALVEIDRMTPLLGILERTPDSRVSLLNIPLLLEREDLLPAVVEDTN